VSGLQRGNGNIARRRLCPGTVTRPKLSSPRATHGFKQLLTKVQQAEVALEAKERRVVDEWRQLRGHLKAAWTPGRVIIAGLVSGFVVGRAQPLRAAARSGQVVQLVTMLSGLFAGGSAQVATEEAQQAAQSGRRCRRCRGDGCGAVAGGRGVT
jgi:hypothetical protein